MGPLLLSTLVDFDKPVIWMKFLDFHFGNNRSRMWIRIFDDPHVRSQHILGARVAMQGEGLKRSGRGEVPRPFEQIFFRDNPKIGPLNKPAAALVASRIKDEEGWFVTFVHQNSFWRL